METEFRMTLMAVPSSNADPQRLGDPEVLQGWDLSRKQASNIAAKIRRGTGDLRSRFLLLGYYCKTMFRTKAAMKARSRQVLWMIEHLPGHSISKRGWCTLNYGILSDRDAIRQAKHLWNRHIETFSTDARVIANAASFFAEMDEDAKAETLFNKAKQVDPNNPAWPRRLSSFFELRSRFAKSAKRKKLLAQKALAEAELAFKLEKSGYGKFLMLDDLAWKAYEAGDHAKSREYVHTIFEFAERTREEEISSSCCKAIHNAHLVLGCVALKEGDVPAAVEHLLASVTVPEPSPENT
ncbi:MAG: tetratricopeptide repeat protein, partial [Terriglobales bacterium]